MINFPIIVGTAGAVLFFALVALLANRAWLYRSLNFVLYLAMLVTVIFGMGGRGLYVEALDRGHSMDYVEGMAARDRQLRTARILILILGTGVFVFSFAGRGRE